MLLVTAVPPPLPANASHYVLHIDPKGMDRYNGINVEGSTIEFEVPNRPLTYAWRTVFKDGRSSSFATSDDVNPPDIGLPVPPTIDPWQMSFRPV